MAYPVVVMDAGTALTKIGYAGNVEPTHVIPTVLAEPGRAVDSTDESTGRQHPLADLNFAVGGAAAARIGTGWRVSTPISHGIVVDWDGMEKVWQHCIYKYLRVEPEEMDFLLTEPPGHTPESRACTAEVMFETFGARSLHMEMQGPLALRACASSLSAQQSDVADMDTGVVVDSGAGATYVIPIVNGYVLEHAIQHITLAGRNITDYILRQLRERREPLAPDGALATAERIKEKYAYVCRDLPAEFQRFDSDLRTHIVVHRETNALAGKTLEMRVGYERFLGPELLFRPEMVGNCAGTATSTSNGCRMSLPEAVDAAIRRCPIDTRRPLYQNIVVAGGTTTLAGFSQRLQAELRALVKRRAQEVAQASPTANCGMTYDVRVISHERQRYAAWCGGSALGASPQFAAMAVTRQQYEEEGPRSMYGRGFLP